MYTHHSRTGSGSHSWDHQQPPPSRGIKLPRVASLTKSYHTADTEISSSRSNAAAPTTINGIPACHAAQTLKACCKFTYLEGMGISSATTIYRPPPHVSQGRGAALSSRGPALPTITVQQETGPTARNYHEISKTAFVVEEQLRLPDWEPMMPTEQELEAERAYEQEDQYWEEQYWSGVEQARKAMQRAKRQGTGAKDAQKQKAVTTAAAAKASHVNNSLPRADSFRRDGKLPQATGASLSSTVKRRTKSKPAVPAFARTKLSSSVTSVPGSPNRTSSLAGSMSPAGNNIGRSSSLTSIQRSPSVSSTAGLSTNGSSRANHYPEVPPSMVSLSSSPAHKQHGTPYGKLPQSSATTPQQSHQLERDASLASTMRAGTSDEDVPTTTANTPLQQSLSSLPNSPPFEFEGTTAPFTPSPQVQAPSSRLHEQHSSATQQSTHFALEPNLSTASSLILGLTTAERLHASDNHSSQSPPPEQDPLGATQTLESAVADHPSAARDEAPSLSPIPKLTPARQIANLSMNAAATPAEGSRSPTPVPAEKAPVPTPPPQPQRLKLPDREIEQLLAAATVERDEDVAPWAIADDKAATAAAPKERVVAPPVPTLITPKKQAANNGLQATTRRISITEDDMEHAAVDKATAKPVTQTPSKAATMMVTQPAQPEELHIAASPGVLSNAQKEERSDKSEEQLHHVGTPMPFQRANSMAPSPELKEEAHDVSVTNTTTVDEETALLVATAELKVAQEEPLVRMALFSVASCVQAGDWGRSALRVKKAPPVSPRRRASPTKTTTSPSGTTSVKATPPPESPNKFERMDAALRMPKKEEEYDANATTTTSTVDIDSKKDKTPAATKPPVVSPEAAAGTKKEDTPSVEEEKAAQPAAPSSSTMVETPSKMKPEPEEAPKAASRSTVQELAKGQQEQSKGTTPGPNDVSSETKPKATTTAAVPPKKKEEAALPPLPAPEPQQRKGGCCIAM